MYKDITNNWIAENTQTLKFHGTESFRDITAKWTSLYILFCESAINMTQLNYQTFYPDRFEQEKVPLVVNVF